MRFDAIVIGSGQGGNPLAYSLTDHGWTVALIVAHPLEESQTVIVAVPADEPLIVTVLPLREAPATDGLLLFGIESVPETFDMVTLELCPIEMVTFG